MNMILGVIFVLINIAIVAIIFMVVSDRRNWISEQKRAKVCNGTQDLIDLSMEKTVKEIRINQKVCSETKKSTKVNPWSLILTGMGVLLYILPMIFEINLIDFVLTDRYPCVGSMCDGVGWGIVAALLPAFLCLPMAFICTLCIFIRKKRLEKRCLLDNISKTLNLILVSLFWLSLVLVIILLITLSTWPHID